MYKIGVMGERDAIYGFAGVGVEVIPVDDPASGARFLREHAEEYAVLYVTEALAAAMAGEIARYDTAVTPAIIPIPGAAGNTGEGLRRVGAWVAKAVGSDILPD